MNKIRKNIGYQTIYQILSTLLPLVTAPYLSRVFTAEYLGIFSYTTSVVSYFTFFAMLGFTTYGIRMISSKSENVEDRNRTFMEIYILQVITCCLAFVFYVFYLLLICKENKVIAWIQSLSIVACFFDVNWFFFGIEEFEIIVKRNLLVKISSVLAILIFVKKVDDLKIYTLIIVGSILISQLILWLYLPKYIHVKKLEWSKIFSHLSPVLILFIPIIAMSIYQVMDKTMLGIFSTNVESGYYYNADKIVNVPFSILTAFGAVLMPRISSLLHSGNEDEAKELFLSSTRAVAFTAIALSFGIASIAQELTPIFFGHGYERCIELIKILAPLLLIKGYSESIRSLYLIPHQLDHIYIYSVFIGAGINLICNILFIPSLGAMGAVIGTLFAEMGTCVSQLFFIRKQISFKNIFSHLHVYIVIGVVMMATVRISSTFFSVGILSLIFEVFVGAVTFIILSISYIFLKDLELRKVFFGK